MILSPTKPVQDTPRLITIYSFFSSSRSYWLSGRQNWQWFVRPCSRSCHHFTSINKSLLTQHAVIKKVVYQYDDMSKNDWSAFGASIDQRCKNTRLNFLSANKIQTIHHLNYYWDLLQKSIIDAATKTSTLRTMLEILDHAS